MHDDLDDRTAFITIVSGLPRSGTSMMMQMLEAGGVPPLTDHVRGPDADNPRGYYEYEAVKHVARDPSWLDHAYGRATKMVYQLLYDLPEGHPYRIILMERNLAEVVASQNAMLERHGHRVGDLDDSAVAGVFHRHLDDLLTWLQRQPRFRFLRVSYNDVLTDPDGEIARVDRFLGGALDTRAMLRALDASLYRQRR